MHQSFNGGRHSTTPCSILLSLVQLNQTSICASPKPRVREARFQSGVVAADLWPSANTSASYSRSSRSIGISTIPPKAKVKRDLYEAGFDASWEIDLFGGKRRASAPESAQCQRGESPLQGKRFPPCNRP
jgi:outer membrane protein TolC